MGIKLLQKGMDGEEREARDQIVPGIKLYGYLSGLFGNNYGIKKVMIVSEDNIIAEEDGVRVTSHYINGDPYTWTKLIEDSNYGMVEAIRRTRVKSEF